MPNHSERKAVQIHFRTSEEIKQKVEALAKRENLTVTNMIEQLIIRAHNEQEI